VRYSREHPIADLAFVIGLFVLAFGLYLALQAFGTEAVAIFSRPIIDFVPYQPLELDVSCPGVLAQDEPGTVSVTIPNPSDEPTAYALDIHVYQTPHGESSTGSVSVSGPEPTHASMFWGIETYETTGTVPAHGTVRVNWQVRVTEKQGQAVGVQVYTNTATGLYSGACGIALIPIPGLTGKATVLFILLSIPASLGLWIYGRWPPRCLTYVGVITIGLLWLFIAWNLV
jgi:hypothetical protein